MGFVGVPRRPWKARGDVEKGGGSWREIFWHLLSKDGLLLNTKGFGGNMGLNNYRMAAVAQHQHQIVAIFSGLASLL
jgi:hypothetical protein